MSSYTEILKSYQKEFASHVVWDPDEKETLTPHKEIDRTKAIHVVKRFIKEAGYEDQFAGLGGDTLYKVLNGFFFGDLVILMSGGCTPEQLIANIGEKVEAGKYPLLNGDGEDTIKAMRKAQRIVNEFNKVTRVTSKALGEMEVPDGPSKTAIDSLLSGVSLPSIDALIEHIGDAEGSAKAAAIEARDALNELDASSKEVERLSNELRNLATQALTAPREEVVIEADGTIPKGTLTFKKASEVFEGIEMSKDFDVPTWEWDGVHPDVPAADNHYIFRPDYLIRVLYAIITNKRAYLQGHTGSGKTTLIEQVAARLGYPFVRVNFDSEVTRMDLIGRDVLSTDDDGNTISTFVDGMLPRAMANPCILCCDEIDFVRPDVAYVMQAALEGNGLRITEDGDRYIKPHPDMRMFATGNTVGQGDEFSMYQGARPQSLALLDRFTVWLKIEYLKENEREDLIKRHYPMLKDTELKKITKYTREHLAAFDQQDITQPLSPRGMLALAEATVLLDDMGMALQMTVLDKANREDYVTLKGIVDRVV